MRATLVLTLLITAMAASPTYARPGDGNRRPPGGGADGGRRPHRGEQRDNDKRGAEADLSPWIQAWAREGIKGKALTQRLEKLMEQHRAGKLPPAPGARDGEKRANPQRPPAAGDGFRPPFGRFGGPQGQGPHAGPGPGMRGGAGGGPGVPDGGRGMMRGPGMRGGPDMRRGPGRQDGPLQPQPQAKRDGDHKPDQQPKAGKGAGAPQRQDAQAMRDIQAQLGKMRDELSKLERRLESNDQHEKRGEGDKPKNPRKRGNDEQ